MSYTALYRVWRPGNFSQVVGQNHISQTLKNAILQNRVSHAYLFTGPRGTGKTSLAKIMGKALNCIDLEQGEPCNQCANCVGINDGSFMDYFEIDAASNRGIDEIREMRERVKFAPSQGRVKVYVIDEVHMLTNEAFNALLKTLEEPPEHVVFILATTEPQKIPLTVLSRCQRYDFKKIYEQGIKERLLEIIEKEKLEVEEEALNLIVRKAEGGMRDAISILDQGISASSKSILTLEEVEDILGTLNEKQLFQIFRDTFKKEPGEMIATLDNYLAEGKDIKQIIKDMADYLRQIILYKVSGDKYVITSTIQDGKNISELSEMKDLYSLNNLLQELIESEQKMYFFSRPRIILESMLLGSMEENSRVHSTENIEKVEKVENKVKKPEKVEQGAPSPQVPLVEKKPEPENDGDIWQEVLLQIKKEKIMLHACLIEGTFVMEDNVGKVIFQEAKRFHQERANQKENLEFMEKIVGKQYNKKIKILSLLEGKEENIPLEIKVEEKNSNVETDILGEALKIFNAEIVEIKD